MSIRWRIWIINPHIATRPQYVASEFMNHAKIEVIGLTYSAHQKRMKDEAKQSSETPYLDYRAPRNKSGVLIQYTG